MGWSGGGEICAPRDPKICAKYAQNMRKYAGYALEIGAKYALGVQNFGLRKILALELYDIVCPSKRGIYYGDKPKSLGTMEQINLFMRKFM